MFLGHSTAGMNRLPGVARHEPRRPFRDSPVPGLVQNRGTVWVGGSGKAGGFAQALPLARRQNHRQPLPAQG
jgi:hypothetical protein